jgi:N-acyl amino acid synthase FeeM
MGVAASASTETFTGRIARLLERVDYRRVESPEDLEPIFRLRYDAYVKEGTLAPGINKRLTDNFDGSKNTWIFGVYIDNQLASSIRLHITSPQHTDMPALPVFADVLLPEVQAGKIIIDPSRFVAEPSMTGLYPQLPYLTVRLPWIACDYFNADYVLATVRAEHNAYYKRVFGFRTVCTPRPYPPLIKPLTLMMLDYNRTKHEEVNHRYPFFRSTFFERRMLFERAADAPRHAASAAA